MNLSTLFLFLWMVFLTFVRIVLFRYGKFGHHFSTKASKTIAVFNTNSLKRRYLQGISQFNTFWRYKFKYYFLLFYAKINGSAARPRFLRPKADYASKRYAAVKSYASPASR